jgi:SPP1 gp7 family putative phage head morphogenesis protein
VTDEQKEILQAQLNREKATIAELKQVYAQAAKDIEANIQALSARTDMENLQTIIYQKQYQEALKAQVNNILEMLHANEFTTIQDYLTHCYTDGYVGVMYDIMAQGIPVIVPINQELVVKALQTDSKISTTLYKKLGEDVNSLKTSIRAELSRGISQGQTWNQIAAKIAKGMNSNYNKAYNNAVRIARTEGHRVQCQSAYDAQKVAKSKGADVVKQWDSTLDNRTRKHHRMLDGQIREVEEPFEVEGMQAMHPSGFGRASEDVNCRCALLQRARWALDEAELQALKERAEYFGLDKTKDFEDFQRKYLQASEQERSSVQKIDKDTSQEQAQEYRPINRSKTVTEQSRGNKTISMRKVENSTYNGGLYISDAVELKPKQMHNIEKSIIDALDIVGDGGNLPSCMIISSAEMQTGAVCAYNATRNIIYIDSIVGDIKKLLGLQKDMACSNNQLSTYVHELLHWKSAEDYRMKAEITNQQEYLGYIREQSKIKLDKLEKEGYNIFEISNYASEKYAIGEFDETLTEYRVLQLLGKDE